MREISYIYIAWRVRRDRFYWWGKRLVGDVEIRSYRPHKMEEK